jgi:hypothetical protein
LLCNQVVVKVALSLEGIPHNQGQLQYNFSEVVFLAAMVGLGLVEVAHL